MPILTIISVLFILYKIIEFPFKLVHAFITGYKDGKEKMKKARAKNKEMVDIIETGLKNNNNKIYYDVQEYSNKGSLKQFVNFILPVNSEYKIVNKELSYYFFTKQAKYPLKKYFGKKEELKDTIVISDMGQMYLENMLSKLFGQKVVMEPMIWAF